MIKISTDITAGETLTCWNCKEEFDNPWYSVWAYTNPNGKCLDEIEFTDEMIPSSDIEDVNEEFKEFLIKHGFTNAIIVNGGYCPYCATCID